NHRRSPTVFSRHTSRITSPPLHACVDVHASYERSEGHKGTRLNYDKKIRSHHRFLDELDSTHRARSIRESSTPQEAFSLRSEVLFLDNQKAVCKWVQAQIQWETLGQHRFLSNAARSIYTIDLPIRHRSQCLAD